MGIDKIHKVQVDKWQTSKEVADWHPTGPMWDNENHKISKSNEVKPFK